MTSEVQMRREEREWEKEKEILIRKERIRKEKSQIVPRLSTSKKALIFLLANCTIIELFTFWVIIQQLASPSISLDLTPLVALIGAVIGEVITVAAYYAKSAKENTIGGIVYETTLKKEENNSVG